MLIVTVQFTIKTEYWERFLQRMRQQARESLEREAGCRHFDIATAMDNSPKVFLYEIYTDEAAFAAHAVSPHYQAFDAETRSWVEEKRVERWTGPWL